MDTPEYPNQIKLFSYVTAQKAQVYRAIMTTFREAKMSFTLALRPAEVGAALAVQGLADASDPNCLDAELKELRAWGNLDAHNDTTEVATIEDFYKARYLYQMTPGGEAAEEAIHFFESHLEQPGELQSAALAAITDRLEELRALAKADDLDQGKVHASLKDLTNRFEELTAKAQKFIAGLQRTVDLHGVSRKAFLLYKQRLIEYLESFIRELLTATFEIASLLEDLESLHMPRMLRAAIQQDLADVFEPSAKVVNQIETRWQKRWEGLCAWFIGHDGKQSQAELLRSRARAAIPALLNAVSSLNDRRVARSDRTADLKTLARWFAQTDRAHQAHRLWRAAFALTPARHLRIDDKTLARRDANPIPSNTSWLKAEAIHVSLRMRKTGHFGRKRGPQPRVRDLTAEKAALTALLDEEVRQIEAARFTLAKGRRMRLSDLETLDPTEFRLFLDLLGEALAKRVPPYGPVDAASSDGTLTIHLEPCGNRRQATITTTFGTFTGPDFFITIRDAFVRRYAQVTG